MKKLQLAKSVFFASFYSTILSSTSAFAAQLEEIIVTAQKREQNLNDVGIAVTAFSGDDVRRLGFNEPVDLAAQTPNLNINNTFGMELPTSVSVELV